MLRTMLNPPNKEVKDGYQCNVCHTTSRKREFCCGRQMKRKYR